MWFNLQPHGTTPEPSLGGTEIGPAFFPVATRNKCNRGAWGACGTPGWTLPHGHPQTGLPVPPPPRSPRAVPTRGGVPQHPQPPGVPAAPQLPGSPSLSPHPSGCAPACRMGTGGAGGAGHGAGGRRDRERRVCLRSRAGEHVRQPLPWGPLPAVLLPRRTAGQLHPVPGAPAAPRAAPRPTDVRAEEPQRAEPAEPRPHGDPDADDPDAGDPDAGDPGPSDPNPGDPSPGDPNPSNPGPSDPNPGDPSPADPNPGDPDPGDPDPGDPGGPDATGAAVPGAAAAATGPAAPRRAAQGPLEEDAQSRRAPARHPADPAGRQPPR